MVPFLKSNQIHYEFGEREKKKYGKVDPQAIDFNRLPAKKRWKEKNFNEIWKVYFKVENT